MAYTVTELARTVHGNQRCRQVLVTSDATSGVVDSGMGVVTAFSYAPVSMNTAGIKLRRNLNAASATSAGMIMVDDTTSGDEFILTIYGR
jgi:hypothetical protein